MTKLGNRSLRVFISYAAIVLACSIPAYYYITDRIWQHELKEHNHIVATGIREQLQGIPWQDSSLRDAVELWNRLQPERQLSPCAQVREDSTYNMYRYGNYGGHMALDRFQGLVTYFELQGKPYSLTVETNMEESHETIFALTAVGILFFAILLLGLVLLNRKLSARLWKPFYKSLAQIQAFDLDTGESPAFPATDIVEFEALNQSLDKLIATNVSAYRRQKQFVENASHELQTPLAIVQSKLDLLLQDADLSGPQAALMTQMQQALARVNRVNRNLLLLARLENSQFPQQEQTDLSALLNDCLELVRDFSGDQQLEFRVEIASMVTVLAAKTLAEILLSNLLLNAVRYSPEHTAVVVRLLPGELLIANSGAAALQQEYLFQRFGNASAHTPGTGLGLAIVAQICRQYGWTISYAFSEGQHQFRVVFAGA